LIEIIDIFHKGMVLFDQGESVVPYFSFKQSISKTYYTRPII